jgi:hypothetical protein
MEATQVESYNYLIYLIIIVHMQKLDQNFVSELYGYSKSSTELFNGQ